MYNNQEKLIIIDFGSQYTQLIANLIRRLTVYCEVIPYTKFNNIFVELKHTNSLIKGIILSGGPFSVTVGIEENLNEDEIRQILIESVGVLGTKPEQAVMFAQKYDEYLMNPKYLGMIENGRSAMTAQINGDPDAAQKLDKAMDAWNSKTTDEDTSVGTIAVMFTDIVGSTDMTQTHGDAAAQEVVRTHNRIVRNALTTYQGREVKHTGDGIMASFNNTANGVAAAIYIQQKTAENNSSNPDVPLGIKIGINAGEPIVEDDDLFGTTVQLSARIVDKAGDKEIFVSEIVKGICLGKDFNFESRGAREMKGFKDPITLYEVLWQ